jgi:Zn-dependent protease
VSQLFQWPPSWTTLYLVPALFVGFTVHELAHATVAFVLGDTSQVERNRLSFNPLRHVSWLGMLAFLLIGLGWAKPVWVDQTRFRIKNRDLGMFLVSIAGVSANFATALLVLLGMSVTMTVVWMSSGSSLYDVLQFMMPLELGPDARGVAVALSYYMLMVNLLLGLFNLLPLPPLDGFQALQSLYRWLRRAMDRTRAVEDVSPGTVEVATADLAARSPAKIHFDIGLEYQRAGQWDEAIARYRQAIDHDEDFALAYYNQGLAYWAKDRPALATSAFRAASLSGDDVEVRIQAGLRLRELAEEQQGARALYRPQPLPLEPGNEAEMVTGTGYTLDPALTRRVWLRLAVGGMAMLVLAVAAWLVVTAVTLAAMV